MIETDSVEVKHRKRNKHPRNEPEISPGESPPKRLGIVRGMSAVQVDIPDAQKDNEKITSNIISSFSRYDLLEDVSQAQELVTMSLEDIYHLRGGGTENDKEK